MKPRFRSHNRQLPTDPIRSSWGKPAVKVSHFPKFERLGGQPLAKAFLEFGGSTCKSGLHRQRLRAQFPRCSSKLRAGWPRFPLPSFQCSVRGSRHALRENLWQLSVSETDIRRHFWKSGYTELAEAASLPANTLTQRFEDDQVFEDHAKICLHIGRIPSEVRAMDWND